MILRNGDQQLPKSSLKARLPTILTLGVLLLLGAFLYHNAEYYSKILRLSYRTIAILAVFAFFGLCANGLINYFLYRPLGAPISINVAVGLAAVNALANQLPFAAGMIAKAVFLKRRYHMEYTTFLGATLALYVLYVSSSGIAGVTVLLTTRFTTGVQQSPVLLISFFLMSVTLIIFWVPTRLIPEHFKERFRLKEMLRGWHILRERKSLCPILIVIHGTTLLFFAFRYWIAFRMFSQPVTFSQCLLFAAASILTQLANMTPGGLGVREAIVAAVAALHGIDPALSVAAVTIDRIVATSVVMTIGALYGRYFGRQLSEYNEVDERGVIEQTASREII